MRQLLLLTLAGAAVLGACTKKETAPEPVRAVRTMTVGAQSAGGMFEYAAEIRARTESRLGFRVGGKITRRLVGIGDRVKPGQVLAQVDAQDLRLGQDAARAGQSAARVSLDQAQADFKRYKDLRDQGFISSAELERRETTLKSAQAQLEQSNAQLSVQGNQAGYAALLADAAGIVTAVEAEPGMVVAAGVPVVRVAVDGPRDVVFSVPEDKVELIKAVTEKPGSVKVRFWGSDSDVQTATIREIAASADPVTRTFLVKADLMGPVSTTIRLGQTATVAIELPRQTGVAKIPLSAMKQEQGSASVWVVDKATMTVQPRKIRVTGADGNELVVNQGLAEGDIVVTAGVHVLNPGQKVRFYAEPGAPVRPASAAPAAPAASAVPATPSASAAAK